jgi:hypothetical protein
VRDPDRIDPLIETLRARWKEHPDWRLGQLIANAVRAETGRVNCDPFYIEDDEMLRGLDQFA